MSNLNNQINEAIKQSVEHIKEWAANDAKAVADRNAAHRIMLEKTRDDLNATLKKLYASYNGTEEKDANNRQA